MGGYRSGAFAEDYDLFLRLIDAGFDLETRPVVRHGWRVHDQMSTRTDPRYSRDAHAGLKAESLVRRHGVSARPIIILGAGKEGRRIARALQARAVTVSAFVDVSPRVVGRNRRGAPVHDARELPALHRAMPDAFAIGAVGTSGARVVVRGALVEAGFVEGVDAAVVA